MRYLFATWDGAGNLVPTLALAEALARAGHDVRVLGHASIDARIGAHGWRFRPLARTAAVDSTRPSGGDIAGMARDLWFSNATAADVSEELTREPAEVLVADCMLFGALSAGEAARLPTVSLFHGAFTVFRRGPLADMLGHFLGELNDVRRRLQLPDVERVTDVHDRCALSLVATPAAFESEQPWPSNVVFAGPLLDGPPLMAAIDVDGSRFDGGADRPLVLVSFSTSQQGQHATVQRIANALASLDVDVVITTGPALTPDSLDLAPNVRAVRFVPHRQVLDRASLVVTHAGLGTVMAALAHGVPLLCLPLGRDQFFNAGRVRALGAGEVLPADADEALIARSVAALLSDAAVRSRAVEMAATIAPSRDGSHAVALLERLAIAVPATAQA